MEESGQTATMIRKSSIRDLSTWMYYTMILLVVSLPLSEFGMSVTQFILLGLWIYEGAHFQKNDLLNARRHLIIVANNIIWKFKRVISNHVLMVFLIIYFLHLVGFLYTSDLSYGLKDIRIKLPLLSIPIFFATSKPLSSRQLIILLVSFILAVTYGTFASIYTLITRSINDPREISIYISHIRFSLFISFSIFILSYFVFKNIIQSKLTKLLATLTIIWLVVFLFILKSLTGIFITGILVLTIIPYLLLKRKKYLLPALTIIVIVFLGTWFYVRNVYREITIADKIDWQNLDTHTDLGNTYLHDTINFGIEGGSYVGMYLSIPELRESWNKRSELDFDSLDNKNQVLKYTLIRFLHSKGFKKNASGVMKLTSEEINQIENGIANVNYLNSFNIRTRFDQLIQGYLTYKSDNDPNASSFMQRIEYWKTAIWLIEKRPIFGYGTGDVKLAFENAYISTNSKLLPEYRHRSHNQFLAITVAFGLVGFILFVLSIMYPPFILGKFRDYLYFTFFFISIFSFLTEDTLETQAGATFFAFFSGLFLFNMKIKLVTEKSRSNKST